MKSSFVTPPRGRDRRERARSKNSMLPNDVRDRLVFWNSVEDYFKIPDNSLCPKFTIEEQSDNPLQAEKIEDPDYLRYRLNGTLELDPRIFSTELSTYGLHVMGKINETDRTDLDTVASESVNLVQSMDQNENSQGAQIDSSNDTPKISSNLRVQDNTCLGISADAMTAALRGGLFLNPLLFPSRPGRSEGTVISAYETSVGDILKYSSASDKVNLLFSNVPNFPYPATMDIWSAVNPAWDHKLTIESFQKVPADKSASFSSSSRKKRLDSESKPVIDEITLEYLFCQSLLESHISSTLNLRNIGHFEREMQEKEDIIFEEMYRKKFVKNPQLMNVESSPEAQSVNFILCCVCLETQHASYNPVLSCTCGYSVHAECYFGIKTPQSILDIEPSSWRCDKCLVNSKECCKACGDSVGIMKRVEKSGWCHVVCALFIQSLEFRDPDGLDTIFGFEKIQKDFSKLPCVLCSRKGFTCIQCSSPRCNVSFHVHCAVMAGYEISDRVTKDNFKIYCEKHREEEMDSAIVNFVNSYKKSNKKMYKQNLRIKNSSPIKVSPSKAVSRKKNSKSELLSDPRISKRSEFFEYCLKLFPEINLFDSTNLDLCEICLEEYTDSHNVLVFCDSCNMAVHQSCYNIAAVPEENWYCLPCAEKRNKKCLMCPVASGAMVHFAGSSSYVHTVCGQYIAWLYFNDKNEVCGVDKIPPAASKLVCDICGLKSGVCTQCSNASCTSAMHVSCALYNGYEMFPDVNEKNGETKYVIYCNKHRKNPLEIDVAAFLLKDSVVPKFDKKLVDLNKQVVVPTSLSCFLNVCNICLFPAAPNVPLLICRVCKVSVHNTCYACESSSDWICDLCKVGTSLSLQQCALCPYSGGAMKFASGKWAHVLCLLSHPECFFNKVERVFQMGKIFDRKSQKCCMFCQLPGFLTKCHECKLANTIVSEFHITCAREKGLPIADVGAQDVIFYSFCPKHKEDGYVKRFRAGYFERHFNIRAPTNVMLIGGFKKHNVQFDVSMASSINLPSIVRIVGGCELSSRRVLYNKSNAIEPKIIVERGRTLKSPKITQNTPSLPKDLVLKSPKVLQKNPPSLPKDLLDKSCDALESVVESDKLLKSPKITQKNVAPLPKDLMVLDKIPEFERDRILKSPVILPSSPKDLMVLDNNSEARKPKSIVERDKILKSPIVLQNNPASLPKDFVLSSIIVDPVNCVSPSKDYSKGSLSDMLSQLFPITARLQNSNVVMEKNASNIQGDSAASRRLSELSVANPLLNDDINHHLTSPNRHKSSLVIGSPNLSSKPVFDVNSDNKFGTSIVNSERLYCVCRQPFMHNIDNPMICCDSCKEWFHCSCLGLDAESFAKRKWQCSKCAESKVRGERRRSRTVESRNHLSPVTKKSEKYRSLVELRSGSSSKTYSTEDLAEVLQSVEDDGSKVDVRVETSILKRRNSSVMITSHIVELKPNAEVDNSISNSLKRRKSNTDHAISSRDTENGLSGMETPLEKLICAASDKSELASDNSKRRRSSAPTESIVSSVKRGSTEISRRNSSVDNIVQATERPRRNSATPRKQVTLDGYFATEK